MTVRDLSLLVESEGTVGLPSMLYCQPSPKQDEERLLLPCSSRQAVRYALLLELADLADDVLVDDFQQMELA